MLIISNIRLNSVIFCFLFLFCTNLCGQQEYRGGALPAINFNQKLQRNWELNVKFESRHIFIEKNEGEPSVKGYDYGLSDLSLLTAKRVGLQSKLIGGYLLRTRPDGKPTHRIIQQFTTISSLGPLRLGHRFAADQTYSSGQSPIFRFRYRISSEIPITGEIVDVGEFYIKLNNEYLHRFRDSEYSMEIRIIPYLGLQLNDRNKIEVGLDSRLDGLFDDGNRLTTWVAINWYLK